MESPTELLPLWQDLLHDDPFERALQTLFALCATAKIRRLVLRVCHSASGQLETLAVAGLSLASGERRHPFSTSSQQQLLSLAPRSLTARELRRLQPGLLPEGVSGEVLVLPLFCHELLQGVLLCEGETMAEAELLPRLSAATLPLCAMLERQRHLRELETLREAAAADRSSLLAKLDREDISPSIIGAETGLKGVMERVEMVSRSETPVLLLGETGSGKEVVARAIHSRSRRCDGPFLRVNCGAIPPELVDSQLFGHERGSFTGAHELRKGWFERADGGTLFLDEVGELPAVVQVRLLRILQDGSFERVGGQKTLSTDLRIIAATHRNMRAMVLEGAFREDLWYRLAIFPIDIPPLRQRPEDIPALATHYAVHAAKRLGGLPLWPTPDDLRLLGAYAWPGNVRELAAVIERAVILGNGRYLDLSRALGMQQQSPAVVAPCDHFPTLDEAQRLHIERALQRCRGTIEGERGAARLLGINPHTLRARMRKLGIAWSEFRS